MPRLDKSSGGGGRVATIILGWLLAIVAAVTSRGEPGADFAGFGGADRGVAGEGFLPVVPGLKRTGGAWDFECSGYDGTGKTLDFGQGLSWGDIAFTPVNSVRLEPNDNACTG